MRNKYIKTIFNDGVYSFTITDFRASEGKLELFMTCDAGEKLYQILIDTFPTNAKYLGRLKRFCTAINYEPLGISSSPTFGEQFIGKRLNATVGTYYDAGTIRNQIMNYDLPTPAEKNVLVDKTDDHFYTQHKPKKNPLTLT
jgi:hypothetical protein